MATVFIHAEGYYAFQKMATLYTLEMVIPGGHHAFLKMVVSRRSELLPPLSPVLGTGDS
jgi:hypothetical protein